MRLCELCGAEYAPRSHHQRFCTEVCRYKARGDYGLKAGSLATTECIYCRREFTFLVQRRHRTVCDNCRWTPSSAPRMCRGGCGGPPSTPRHYYCDGCFVLMKEQRRQKVAERWLRYQAEHGPSKHRPDRPSPTERGYGTEHRRIRSQWAKVVAAGGVCCWRCGEAIPPGSPWDLGHDPVDRSKYRGPEHRKCNRGAAKRGRPLTAERQPEKRSTTQRGLGADHQRLRRELLPHAYGNPCPFCHEPMLVGQPLDLDHSIPRALGAGGQSRMAHASCNREAGGKLRAQLQASSRW